MLRFQTLAETFDELERTSSRRQLTTLLANLLRQVDAEEIAEVTYLLQGRVAPLYEPIEFGLGERTIEKALAQAYGVDAGGSTAALRAAGDLGLVVEELQPRAHRFEHQDRARRANRVRAATRAGAHQRGG